MFITKCYIGKFVLNLQSCENPYFPRPCSLSYFHVRIWPPCCVYCSGRIHITHLWTNREEVLGRCPQGRSLPGCVCVDGGLWEVLNHRHTAVEASDGSLIFCVEHMRTHTCAQLHGCKNILPCDTFCQIMHKVGHFCSTNLHWLMTNLCLSLSLTHFNTLTQAEQPENSAFKKQMDQ